MYPISSSFPTLGFSLFWSIWGQDWCPQGLSTLTVNDPSPETLAHSSLPPTFCPSKSPDISLSMDTASNFSISLNVNVQTLRWWRFLGWGGQVHDDHPSVLYHTLEGVADPVEMVRRGLGVCYQGLSHFSGIRIPLEGLFKQILWPLLPEFPNSVDLGWFRDYISRIIILDPNPEIEPGSPALQADSLPSEPSGKYAYFGQNSQTLSRSSHHPSLPAWSHLLHFPLVRATLASSFTLLQTFWAHVYLWAFACVPLPRRPFLSYLTVAFPRWQEW